MSNTKPQDTLNTNTSEVQRTRCPNCGSDLDLLGPAPPFVAATAVPATPAELDPRVYELSEALGKGGMGEVYRCCDPALGRDLAIKIMKAAHRGNEEIERRFLREARITASLQHPGIVPVHNLGRLPDGRLHYTMRLVRGQTFADILKAEAGKLERLPYLLSIFEKICQAMAYAHSKHVIHRDLKPANVMVGKFGEVQVMDWGLAKVLSGEGEPIGETSRHEAGGTLIHTEETDTPSNLTRAGSGMGTPAYMSPEQALGEVDAIDERTDVFALGSILCEMLTGHPPYRGEDGNRILRQARRGDLAEAWARLETCAADEALTALSRDCLSTDCKERPRDAGQVAQRVAEYQAEVQERLRSAELERVAAETKAREEQARAVVEQERTREALARAAAEMERVQEAQARAKAERRAKRQTLALAAAILILMSVGGGGFWWQQRMRDRADQAVLAGLAQAELLEQQAQETPLEPSKYHQAREAAHVAARLAQGASDAVHGRAEELVARLKEEEAAVERDRRLLTALLEVRRPQEGPKYTRGDRGVMMASAEATAEEQFVSAFRAWGLDVDALPTEEAAARLKQRPKTVVTEVIAGLDDWASQRRIDRKPETAWRRLAELAAALDDEPSSKRSELREILARGRLPMERSLAVLSRMMRPVPIAVELPLGRDRIRLRQLADHTDPAAEPLLGLLTLTRALRAAGEDVRAEQLLRAATQARPQNVVLHHTLGRFLTEQEPPRWSEAIECYTAARALRPELGIGLADALIYSGRDREGLKLFDQLGKERPDNPYLYYKWAYALDTKGQLDEAIVHLHKAIALDPKYVLAHNYLGWALKQKGQVEEAIAEFRKAITFNPKDVLAHNNLGWALYENGQVEEAIAEDRKAISLDPNYALAHINLGWALYNKGEIEESIAEYNKAILLEPNNSLVHNNLGLALETKGQVEEAMVEYRKAIALDPKSIWPLSNLGLVLHNKGQLDEAIACYLKALAIDPKNATAHNNLGWALYNKGHLEEAIAEYRKAIALDSKYVKAHNNLGYALRKQGRLEEAIAEYRKAIQLKPDSSTYHNDLGMALAEYGLSDEAIACYHKAQALDPKDSWPHNNLGLVLKQKGRLDEAIASYHVAIQLDPNNVKAVNNLGEAMCDKGRYDEAVICYQKAIALDPKYVWPHYNLGQILFKQGRYAEAREAIRRSSQVSSRDHLVYQLSTTMLESWEALLAQDKKLPAVLSGKESPSDVNEILCCAGLCQLYKNRYAAAARLYADAFAADSRIDPHKEHVYNAACSAVLAAAGQGDDARLLPDKVAVMFRRWAFHWLREALNAYALRSRQDNPTVKEEIHQQMLRWRCDPNLASVREPEALARLSEKERTAWQSLWHEADELTKRTANQDKAGERGR